MILIIAEGMHAAVKGVLFSRGHTVLSPFPSQWVWILLLGSGADGPVAGGFVVSVWCGVAVALDEVDAVLRVVDLIKRHGHTTPHASNEATSDWAIRA